MKPILFSTPMVRALLDGQKSMTRRVIKQDVVDRFVLDDSGKLLGSFTEEVGDGYPTVDDCNYQYGDILWVRETWTKLNYVDPEGYTHYDQPMYYYAADGEPDITLMDADGFELDDQRIRWKPSIHMPREAARIFLRVTDIRAERLQDITEEDVAAEGAKDGDKYIEPKGAEVASWHKACFEQLWNITLKEKSKGPLSPYRYCFNPWVWVIEFERCEKHEQNS